MPGVGWPGQREEEGATLPRADGEAAQSRPARPEAGVGSGGQEEGVWGGGWKAVGDSQEEGVWGVWKAVGDS